MKLFISASPRTQNCYKIVKDIMNVDDAFFPLNELDIHYCRGCFACRTNRDGRCIMQDDMDNIYDNIKDFDSFILVSPIYFNQISAQAKTFIDRLFPCYEAETLKGKKIYLILVGEGTKEENKEEIESIDKYFDEISIYLKVEFVKTWYFQEGDMLKFNYIDRIMEIKNTIYKN